jgi:hypothetical protein
MDEEVFQIAIIKMKITTISFFFIYTQIGYGGEGWELSYVYFSGCKYERVIVDFLNYIFKTEHGMLELGCMYLSKEVVHFPMVSVSVGLLKDSVKRKIILKSNNNI